MQKRDPFEQAVTRAQYYREICLEAADSAKYGFMARELLRQADMWQRFVEQVEKDARFAAESRAFLAHLEKHLKL